MRYVIRVDGQVFAVTDTHQHHKEMIARLQAHGHAFEEVTA